MNHIIIFGEQHKILALFKIEADLSFITVDSYYKNDISKVLEKKEGFGLVRRQGNEIVSIPVAREDERFPYAVCETLIAEGFNAYVISETKASLIAFFDKEISDMAIKEPAFLDIMKMGDEDAQLFAQEFFQSLG